MDKNKDTVPEELLSLLQNSKSQFLADMITPVPTTPTVSFLHVFMLDVLIVLYIVGICS
jgi:hypothetical protein